jgi:hypothetical protein
MRLIRGRKSTKSERNNVSSDKNKKMIEEIISKSPKIILTSSVSLFDMKISECVVRLKKSAIK